MEYITVSDRIRLAFQSNPEYLQEILDRINISLRMFHQSLLGRDIKPQQITLHVQDGNEL